ncbi:type VI secretion system membrane subunit TssM [Pelagibaculum spongiae]|uniref:Type VI secretion system membrane subunit TssM n=1 Tax=Pelagibaculum spongiae TaxID=2080658 RepID=A0A2V1GX07_9GAMM|nr:type VI secretion system membrane subunit TssM [Pelagibaculum spongiae]PVZ68784.1 type VI secretion system membrane subunit TssM [Pelagibaculum spongiae]
MYAAIGYLKRGYQYFWPGFSSFSSIGPLFFLLFFIVINLLIWWLGPQLQIDQQYPLQSVWGRTIASSLFSLLFIAIFGLVQWRNALKNQSKSASNQSTTTEQQAANHSSKDPLEAHLKEQLSQLRLMQQQLHSTFSNKHDYQKPWYLMLGMPSSGKTSLIHRSGQKILASAGKQLIVASKSRRLALDNQSFSTGNLNQNSAFKLDWWLTDQALLIDIDGQLVSQGQIDNLQFATSESGVSYQHDPGNAGKGTIEKNLYQQLIGWLAEKRQQQSLSGVVVTLDMQKIATANAQQATVLAHIMRARLIELQQQLNASIKVYLVLSKIDLLQGFDGFFRGLSDSQRAQVLGFSFDISERDSADLWLEHFDYQYQLLVKRLHDLLPSALMRTSQPEGRKAIFSFVRQISGLHKPLSQYLTDMLLEFPAMTGQALTSATPELQVRGMYFTSVYQQGVPDNLFLQAAANKFSVANGVAIAQHAKNSKCYFSQQLFQSVIYPEAGITSPSQQYKSQRIRQFGWSIASAAVLSACLVGGWQHYYQKNLDAGMVLQQSIAGFYQQQDVLADKNSKELHPSYGLITQEQQLLPRLNLIRQALMLHQKTMTSDGNSPSSDSGVFSDLGLFQGDKIQPQLQAYYQKLLVSQFFPILAQRLLQQLLQTESDRSLADGRQPVGKAKLQQLQIKLLALYRMLSELPTRDHQSLISYFSKAWQADFPLNGALQHQLLGHLQYAVKHVAIAGQTELATADNGYLVIENTDQKNKINYIQQQIAAIPIEQRVYHRLRARAVGQLSSDISLAGLVGPDFQLIFQSESADAIHSIDVPNDVVIANAPVIPWLWTRRGMQKFFVGHSNQLVKLALKDNWALGLVDQIEFSQQDQLALQRQVNRLYIADYQKQWLQALDQLELKSFKDIGHGVLILKSIAGDTRPYHRLLAALQQNTAPVAPVSQASLIPVASADKSSKSKLANKKMRLANSDSLLAEKLPSLSSSLPNTVQLESAINQPFSQLNQLLKSSIEQASQLDQLMVFVVNLQQYLNNIAGASDVGNAALTAAKARIQLTDADPIYALERVALQLPTPLNRHFAKLAEQSWQVIQKKAINQLEVRWYREVYQPFKQKLASRYPFNPMANKDVALADFTAFFAPNGILDRFYNNNLKLFVDSGLLQQGKNKKQSLISHHVMNRIRAAEKIRAAFFNRKGVLDVPFTLEPLQLSANKRRSIINIDGQLVEYNHGPRRDVELIWPNTLRNTATSKLTLVSGQVGYSPKSLSHQGPWAFFRLLDQANLIGSSATSVDYRFQLANGSASYRLHAEADLNPFTSSVFRKFRLPANLYR